MRPMVCGSFRWPLFNSAGLLPEPAGNLKRLDAGLFPPCAFVAGAVQRSMMTSAERNGKFITDFAAEGTRLAESKVVGIGRLAAADETRLLADIAKVVPVAIAPRCGNDKHALVDAVGLIGGHVFRSRGSHGRQQDPHELLDSVYGGFCGCGRCELR